MERKYDFAIEVEKAFYRNHPANIHKMSWEEFKQHICQKTFRYYLAVCEYGMDNPGFKAIKEPRARKFYIFKELAKQERDLVYNTIERDCCLGAIGAYLAKGEYFKTTGQNTLYTGLTIASQLNIFNKALTLGKELLTINP